MRRWLRPSAIAIVLAGVLGLATLAGPVGAQTSPSSEPTTTTGPAPSPTPGPSPTTTAPAPPTSGDSLVEASVAFRVCPLKGCAGERVLIDNAANHYGPKGYSLCTKDERAESLTPRGNGEVRTFSMVAKSGGTCFFEPSYNVWLIEVYQGQKLLSRGLVWVGENTAGLQRYYAKCVDTGRWVNFVCASVSGDGLSLVVGRKDVPAPPTEPPCPSSGSLCQLDIHFDTKACPNFAMANLGACIGTATGAAVNFVAPVQDIKGLYAGFSWQSAGKRIIRYATVHVVPDGTLDGSIANGSSTAFVVADAFALLSPYPGVHWYTPDRSAPGEPYGPLKFTFVNGILGADIYLQGYLARK